MTMKASNSFRINVALVYNSVDDFIVKPGDPVDINCEWSSDEYVAHLREGLSNAGFNVIDVGEPINLVETVKDHEVDVVFSIAEMVGYRYREVLLPALCEILDIPYLFAKPDAMFVTADKELSNLYAEQVDVSVPRSRVIRNARETNDVRVPLPWILKPNAEGGSMGIFSSCVVNSVESGNALAGKLLREYNQPVLLQHFVQGKEYTVGVLEEGGEVRALTPLVVFDEVDKNKVFDKALKADYKHRGLFRPVVEEDLAFRIKEAAEKVFSHIGCRHASRLDFRLDDRGRLNFIEINGLTDFHPKSAMCVSAKLSGIGYEELLQRMVNSALCVAQVMKKKH